ncbi:MAG: precorrin-6A reductase [Oscillospiraceae bacterium]|nr:precorrin-6A reductase [Oscillospiraceae bacterium]
MYDVILFGGTDEGHKISDFLLKNNISHIVCVATEYGAEILGNKNVHIGRMTADEMGEFFSESGAKIVVDATHPYADKVTENIKEVCEVKYIRVVREDTDGDGICFENTALAAKYLQNTVGNILITTGSKKIKAFSALANRAFARVLPTEESVRLCAEAGFEMKRVICMQGPFSKEFNSALIKELNIKYLVTKRTGKSGGFLEKIDAAKENNTVCIIIDRPVKENGVSLKQAEKLILEWL